MKLKDHQKTTVPATETLVQKFYLADVKGKTLGHSATKIANLLRGKDKVFFTPQHDCGDHVVVINAKYIKLTGNKAASKTYHWHTGYGAGFRTRTAQQLMEKNPGEILYKAVWGMLPRNKLRKHIMRKLRIFPDEKHEQNAQKLESIQL